MLDSLHIKNYALIETLDIDFQSGFSVITGETGAGKSIMLGAIGLLLGQRADAKAIKTGQPKCVVEARFSISNYGLEPFFESLDIDYEPDHCIMRREVLKSGKSRGFINDTPATLQQMRSLGEKLIDVHSQHQNLLLNKQGFQLNILDILAQDETQLSDYQSTYAEWQNLVKELDKLRSQAEQTRNDQDYLRFQLDQLDAAQLIPGEQEQLEKELETMSHSEEIRTALFKVSQLVASADDSLLTRMKDSIHSLRNVSGFFPQAEQWADRLETCSIDLKDILHDIDDAEDAVEFDPQSLDKVNMRLDTLYALMKKHRVQTDVELINLREDFRRRLNDIEAYDDTLSKLEADKDALYELLEKKAAILTDLRTMSALTVEKKMQELLLPLGMPNVRFAVRLSPRSQPDPTGVDSVTFLFSANKNTPLQDVSAIASGGEIARVMLSLKAMIAGAVKLPTIIFDEIDTGVSGKIAEKMAHIMRDIGNHERQVISITHLPQIAAQGSVHYKVYKEDLDTGTVSRIVRLSQEDRVIEIANMLSGETLTQAAITNARELLNM